MNPRKLALDALCDVTDRGAYANLRMKQLSRDLPEREANHAAALVYTTLDHLLTIDFYLAHYTKGTLKPAVRGVLRLGVCELLYMRTPAHAAVNESVRLLQETGKGALSGFVNAVLRAIDRDREHLPAFPKEPLKRLSLQYSYPEWIVSEWISSFGEQAAEELLKSRPAPIEARAQYPTTREELLAALPVRASVNRWDENSLSLEHGFDFASSPLFIEGKFTIMSQAAMLACRALGDVRRQRVLDACAAPGGKSAYIASLFENDVSLTCWELHAHRRELLDRTLERLHVSAETAQKDAAAFDPIYAESFDAVFVDAPCSGLGLLGDKPDIRYAKTDADVNALAELQSRILDACARYVRPGGVLLYATCTISRRENEAQAAHFLETHTDFAQETMPLPFENNGTLQLLPSTHGTDGFFLARFRKAE